MLLYTGKIRAYLFVHTYRCSGLAVVLFVSLLCVNRMYADREQAHLNAFLVLAVQHNDSERVISLLQSGASPEASVEDRPVFSFKETWTHLLHTMLHRHHRSSTALILAAAWNGPHRYELDTSGKTGMESNREIIQALLTAGANVNIQNEKGRTPLMLSAGTHKREAVRLLLAHHADLRLRDDNNRTVIQDVRVTGMEFPDPFGNTRWAVRAIIFNAAQENPGR